VLEPRLLHPREYPLRLAALEPPIEQLWVRGHLGPGIVVAIVGTRTPCDATLAYTTKLAKACVEAGAVVVSGGAYGIDAAAHRGAMAAGGRTWAVLATGYDKVYPDGRDGREDHGPLYEEIVDKGGALVWPFPPGQLAHLETFFPRNRALVALSDAVVVAEAPRRSGALNAAKHARELERALWVVSPPAWERSFEGSHGLLELGARPLTSIPKFLASVRLAPLNPKRAQPSLFAKLKRNEASSTVRQTQTDPAARKVFEVAETTPVHADELIARTSLPAGVVSTALLTLVLENVLVEGPAGFFRRA
jgi:DNA processing protein